MNGKFSPRELNLFLLFMLAVFSVRLGEEM